MSKWPSWADRVALTVSVDVKRYCTGAVSMSEWPSWADRVALTVSEDVKQDLKKYPIFPKDFLQTVPTRSAGEMLPPQ